MLMIMLSVESSGKINPHIPTPRILKNAIWQEIFPAQVHQLVNSQPRQRPPQPHHNENQEQRLKHKARHSAEEVVSRQDPLPTAKEQRCRQWRSRRTCLRIPQ